MDHNKLWKALKEMGIPNHLTCLLRNLNTGQEETELRTLVAQRVKHLSAMQETRVRSLGWEDPLEKEMATHSSILVWRIPWTEEPGRLQSTGSQRVGHNWATSLSFHFHGTTDWFRIEKRVRESLLSPCLTNLYTEHIMRDARPDWVTSWNQDCWEKSQQPQMQMTPF